MIARFVRGGRTLQLAINQKQSVYGYNTSITKIIDTLTRDKERDPGGVHLSLHYFFVLFNLLYNSYFT